uniref:Uncharacterized protein n=1 Tax=Micrurus corallinus TaxID=54390 RepID=A0A2D4EKQ7_MICCO
MLSSQFSCRYTGHPQLTNICSENTVLFSQFLPSSTKWLLSVATRLIWTISLVYYSLLNSMSTKANILASSVVPIDDQTPYVSISFSPLCSTSAMRNKILIMKSREK